MYLDRDTLLVLAVIFGFPLLWIALVALGHWWDRYERRSLHAAVQRRIYDPAYHVHSFSERSDPNQDGVVLERCVCGRSQRFKQGAA